MCNPGPHQGLGCENSSLSIGTVRSVERQYEWQAFCHWGRTSEVKEVGNFLLPCIHHRLKWMDCNLSVRRQFAASDSGQG